MSPAVALPQQSALSPIFGLPGQRSLESCGSSSDGTTACSPHAGIADQGSFRVGHHIYEPVALIGQGSFGTVIRATQHNTLLAGSQCDVAIKLLPRGKAVRDFKTFIQREISHQSSMQHPFIIALKEVFLTPTHLALAMEFAPGGDLFQHVAARQPHPWLPEEQARWIFQQLIIGLDYCHKMGVAVRDLKLENILLDSSWSNGKRPLLKICDFGYSKHDIASPAKTTVGTPVYMAPEIILGGKHYNAKKADLWSCGVILFSLLYGRYPFDASEKHYTRKIVTADYTIPQDLPVSHGCKQLLQQLLVPDPRKRISMEEFMAEVDVIIAASTELGLEGEDLSRAHVLVPKTQMPTG